MSRLYVLVRKDLSESQRSVQAGHAVAQWMMDYPQKWNNEYLIYLGVDNLKSIEYWINKLNKINLEYSVFKEPDMNNSITAISCVSNSKIFSKLKLL